MKRVRVNLRIIGQRIKESRGKYIEEHESGDIVGLTQAQLADRLKVSLETVRDWEQGYRYPDVEMLYKLARLFQCDFDYLFGVQELPRKAQTDICKETGISETAATSLIHYAGSGMSQTLNSLLENSELLNEINQCCLCYFGGVDALDVFPSPSGVIPSEISAKEIQQGKIMHVYHLLCGFVEDQRKKNGLE